jgi:hypothetical protein
VSVVGRPENESGDPGLVSARLYGKQ